VTKKLSRAERKQIRAKSARLRADPSGTPTAAKPPPGDEPAQAQPLHSPPVSHRAQAARAASRSRRQAPSKPRSDPPPEQRETPPEPPHKEKSALSRFTSRLTSGKKRGEHAVLIFLSLVVLAAIIVFVAQRGRPVQLVPETPATGKAAPDKPAAPAAPEPLPPQDDHSPPTIVTAPVTPAPAPAASTENRGAADHAASAAPKPPEAKPKTKPASPPKPPKPPAAPPSEEIY
jgi:hypothetical protein